MYHITVLTGVDPSLQTLLRVKFHKNVRNCMTMLRSLPRENSIALFVFEACLPFRSDDKGSLSSITFSPWQHQRHKTVSPLNFHFAGSVSKRPSSAKRTC